ncbi:response regulator [uncultured Pontibacter sp.]|uniref:response regulator n=1 Tax=uncultured Pontibacter sp. TaxID=453356 RepID=UPI002604732C|nr:response regulator [uncultured Pontibacter sp.]
MFKKVYIIDDDEVTLYLTELVLSLYAPNCISIGIPDAKEAISCLQQDIGNGAMPSHIFLDLNMPVMDGHQFIDKVSRLLPSGGGHPIVYVLTSSISETDKTACLQHELVLGVIEKPLTFEKLEELNN